MADVDAAAAMAACVAEFTASLAGVTDPAAMATSLCDRLVRYDSAAALADEANAGVADAVTGITTMFLVLTGALVFVMHAGFAMLCAGAIRSKNTMNILLQTVLDAAVSAIAFYLVGFAFAYGKGANPNEVIGDNLFALSHLKTRYGTAQWQFWFFQWAFAATATTIPAGAVAERFNFNAYLGYSFFISAFVYPVVVHWVWAGNGWLSYFNTAAPLFHSGMIDFAGSGVVHMVGGLAGLMGAILVGPRMGRFDSNGSPVDMPGHSATLVVLGTVLLWFGWYGFNPGSQLLVHGTANATVVGRAAVVTTLGAAGGAISCLITGFMRNKAWDLIAICNGALVGLVSITAGSNVIEPWAGILAGFVGGWIFDATCRLWLKLKIDDPLSASPMHGVCGAWGVLFVGLLAKKEYIIDSYGRDPASIWIPAGLFYGGEEVGRLLAAQLIGIITITVWVCGCMGIFFAIFKFFGKLRISPEEEQAGLDVSKHGGSAYNYDAGLAGGRNKEASPL